MPKIVMEISDKITILRTRMIIEALRSKYGKEEFVGKIYLQEKD